METILCKRPYDQPYRLFCPYDPEKIREIRSIPDAKWNTEGKFWTIPRTDDHLARIFAIFPGIRERSDEVPERIKSVEQAFRTGKYSRSTRKSYGYHIREYEEYSKGGPEKSEEEKRKKLLGHNSLNTTEIYTHVSREFLRNVKSPLDTLTKIDKTAGQV